MQWGLRYLWLMFGAQLGRCRRGERARVGRQGLGVGPCTAAGGSASSSCTGTPTRLCPLWDVKLRIPSWAH